MWASVGGACWLVKFGAVEKHWHNMFVIGLLVENDSFVQKWRENSDHYIELVNI